MTGLVPAADAASLERRGRFVNDDDVLPPRAVAAWTGLRVTTLCEWRKAGEGPRWLRMGRKRIGYRRGDVKAWLDEQARQSRAG